MTANFVAAETGPAERAFNWGSAAYAVDFGALTIQCPIGVDLSVVMRGVAADTVIVRTRAGQLALNLYAADADGFLPGYVGSCLSCFASEDIAASDIEWVSDGELAGTAQSGMHIRFAAASGPRWFVRASVRTRIDHAAVHAELARALLATAAVRMPRHYRVGTPVELSTSPKWIPLRDASVAHSK